MATHQRILIADDHNLFRAGLRAMLTQEPGIEIAGEADNGHDAIRLVGELAPDLVLMDLTMPGMNGIEALIEIKRNCPHIRVMIMTMHKTEEYVHAALNAHADGYVVKDAAYDEFRVAIRSVLKGKIYLSMDVSEKLASSYYAGGRSPRGSSVFDSLTHREREVLKLVAEGKSTKGIAEFLALSVRTVGNHRTSLMAKLDIHNIASLTAYAIERRVVGG